MGVKPFGTDQIPRNQNTKAHSQAQVDANGRKKGATGPTSPEGKKTSARNALKLGLLAKNVVITTSDNKEDQTEFDGLLAKMRDSYRPVGMAEELAVEEIMISYWRSARALRAERGFMARASAPVAESELSEMGVNILEANPYPVDAYNSLLQTSRGVSFLLLKIEEAKDEVRVSGSLSTKLCRWLVPGKNWQKISYLGKEHVLAELQKKTEELTAIKSQVEEIESEQRNDKRDCSAIPSKDELDRINRYETANVRHRYKVEARLELLQARRRENAKANSGGPRDAESLQEIQSCEMKPTGLGEPQVSGAGAPRVGALKNQLAHEESEASPDRAVSCSQPNETGTAAEADAELPAKQQIVSATEADATASTRDADGAKKPGDPWKPPSGPRYEWQKN